MGCPALIDFEASCLPDYGQSYPIEVAVARMDGSSRAWLIRPSDSWYFWDWSDEAQALHGITPALLAAEGQPVAQVLTQLIQYVSDCDVYADADLDQYWLEVLCQAAGAVLPFSVKHLGELLTARNYSREQIICAVEEARKQLPQEHHARDDAKRLALMLRLLMEDSASI